MAYEPDVPRGLNQNVLDVIIKAAQHYKIPPELALAIAQHESGFNPTAVGDNGTSFGLYQLHQGGELGSHDAAWANDANNNAMTALAEVAKVYHRNPNQDWGTIAALAQRPADPKGYAQDINDILKRSGTGDHARQYFSNAYGQEASIGWADYPGSFLPKTGTSAPATPTDTRTSSANNIGPLSSGGGSGTSGGGAGTGGAASDIGTSSTPQEFEAQLNAAGFAKALLNSDPTLKAVFNQAITQGWYKSATGLDRFQAAIRNTKWWTSRSDSQRAFDERQYSDAKGLQADLGKATDAIVAQAQSNGVNLTPADAAALARMQLRNNMSDQEVASSIAGHFTYDPNSSYQGAAGNAITDIKNLASEYYVPVTNDQMTKWVQQVAAGTLDTKSLTDYFKNQALSLFPYLNQQLNSGQTVKSIADTYKAQMAQTLELDPNGIADKDPTVMKALQYKDPKTGELGLMPLWQYDQTLKQDPRWFQTENAHNTLVGAVSSLAKQWGVMA